MKQVGFLYQFVGQATLLGFLYSIIPSIILGIIVFITGFLFGIAICILSGIINGFILGSLCILFFNKQKNTRIIMYSFAIISVIVAFSCVYISIYLISLYYNHGITIPDYNGLHIISTIVALFMALIMGYANHHLLNWYLNYQKREKLYI